MKQIISNLVLLSLFINCSSTKITNICSVNLDFNTKHTFKVPCYNNKKLEIEYHGQRKYTFYYDSNMEFFISNNLDHSPSKISKYLNEKQNASFVFEKSLYYQGYDKQSDTYWSIKKSSGFLKGYINIPFKHKNLFDQAL